MFSGGSQRQMETEENYRIESFLNATEDNLAVVDASGIIVAPA